MITYIKGTVAYKSPTYIVVEAGGIGYHVNISLHTYTKIEKLEKVQIITHLHIKEDSHTLYGFADETERKLFRQLISVSGIGTATAQILLSSMNPEEVRTAIIQEDVTAFKKVKGVGPKTAKRLILDLKDKMLKDSGDVPLTITPSADNTLRQEALSALVSLQINRIQAQKVLNKILRAKPEVSSVEELIKLAFREM